MLPRDKEKLVSSNTSRVLPLLSEFQAEKTKYGADGHLEKQSARLVQALPDACLLRRMVPRFSGKTPVQGVSPGGLPQLQTPKHEILQSNSFTPQQVSSFSTAVKAARKVEGQLAHGYP